MSERIIEAQNYVSNIFKTNGMDCVLEAMEIVNKYATDEGRASMENDINGLQNDSIKLVALSFYLGTIASNLESDAIQAANIRKFQYSNVWVKFKKENEKITQGALDQMAEIEIKQFREDEVEKERRASIIRAALNSTIEIVNMLKKVVERLLVQGQKQ